MKAMLNCCHCVALVVFLFLNGPASASGQTVTSLAPGDAAVFTSGTLAWLVHAPADGSAPVVVAAFSFGDVVPVPPVPTPSKVTAIWILENQEERTAKQAKVMDDPIWQAAAIAKGLTYRIEDRDHPDAKPFLDGLALPLPVVLSLDDGGEPVAVVPLPATVGEMRKLIGGVK